MQLNPFAFIKGRRSMPNPAGIDVDRLLVAARSAPDLSLLEWDGDDASSQSGDNSDPRHLSAARRRIRDRYVSVRFPGIARCAADLSQPALVIKAARLYFEEEQPGLALEMLELATEEAPGEASLWLARLEILFLARDCQGFVATARAFSSAHPRHEAWSEVERLGRAIAPGEALVGATAGPRAHEHYGPWPHLPNWIQAPWDLTAECAAADFHRALKLN
jgi:hypothetical protein